MVQIETCRRLFPVCKSDQIRVEWREYRVACFVSAEFKDYAGYDVIANVITCF
jgi:hypothetical protein